METIKAIIVDDEEGIRNILSNLLVRSDHRIEIIATCGDLVDAVSTIKTLQPDVVFLDVQMPNYAGYEIGRFFDEINFEIIFVTAYDQFAIKAFELNAIDYIVKPINRTRLKEALDRLVARLFEKSASMEYRMLLDSMQNNELRKIVIPDSNGKHVIELNSIIAIMAMGSYSQIYLSNEQRLTVSKNLKHFESVLPEDDQFFRSHKSWILNMRHVVQFNVNKGEVVLTNDITAKISKNKQQEFRLLSSKLTY